MGLLNFDLKLPDFSNLSSIKDSVMGKIDSLGLNESVDKITGIVSGNSLMSGLSDSVIGSINESMPDFDMGNMIDFDMDSMMGGMDTNSLVGDIDEMVNGINLSID